MLNFPQFGNQNRFQNFQNNNQNNAQNYQNYLNNGWSAMPVMMMVPPPAPQQQQQQNSFDTASSVSMQNMMMSLVQAMVQMMTQLFSSLTGASSAADNSNSSTYADASNIEDTSAADTSAADVSDEDINELLETLIEMLDGAETDNSADSSYDNSEYSDSDYSTDTTDSDIDDSSYDTTDSTDTAADPYVDSTDTADTMVVDDSTDTSDVADTSDVVDDSDAATTTTTDTSDLSDVEAALTANSQMINSLVSSIQDLVDQMAADETSPSDPSTNPAGHSRGRGHNRHGHRANNDGNCGQVNNDCPPVEQPPVDYPPTEEPPVDYPPTEEPPVDYPPTEEPPVDYPPTEEPPVDYPPAEEPPYCPPTNTVRGAAGLNGDPKFSLFTPSLIAAHPELASFESGLKAGDNAPLLVDNDNGGINVDADGVQVDPSNANTVGVGKVNFTVNGRTITADAATGNFIVDGDMAFNLDMDGLVSPVDLGNGASISTAMKIDDAEGNQAERIVVRNGEYEVTLALRQPHPDSANYFDMNFEELTANAAANATGLKASNGFGIAELLNLES